MGAFLALMAAAAALVALSLPASAPPAAGGPASIEVVAVDADPSGNGPRTVGTVQECVSAAVGQPVEVDVVVPSPGVPSDRGISAYQFNLYYDPAIVWVTGEDNKLLLAQAAGSNLVTISDPKPDINGVYVSWAVDFGPSGIEPGGSSEAGSGVVSRITLMPRKSGHSSLTLQDVIVLDDSSKPIAVEAVRGASIYVGEPCPGPTAAPTATSTASPAAPAVANSVPGASPTVSQLAAAGGRPPESRGGAPRLAWAGLAAVLGGSWLLAATWRRRTD